MRLQAASYRFPWPARLRTDHGVCRQHSVARLRRDPAATAWSWPPDHTKRPIGVRRCAVSASIR